MREESQMIDKLRQKLTPDRFIHSLGVRDTAVKLAQCYGVDNEKAAVAGLLHDCAKDVDKRQILQLCGKFDIVLDEICGKAVQLLHGPLGASIAAEQFDIHDEEILDAIYFHTTAKENMSKLTKIIYIADYIEPNRHFKGVEKLRKIAYVNLDKAIVRAIDNTIKYIMQQGKLIHPKTIEARNYILMHERGKTR